MRVLIASRTPSLVTSLIGELVSSSGRFQFVGAIDPGLGSTLVEWAGQTDILLIDSESFLRSRDQPGARSPDWLCHFQTFVLAEGPEVLDVVSRRVMRLILLPTEGRLGPLIHLATQGFTGFSADVLENLRKDLYRMDIVAAMPLDERQVLDFLGAASSAREIEVATGFSPSQVKALTQTVIRKLRLRNRTAVAAFATTHRPPENGTLPPRFPVTSR